MKKGITVLLSIVALFCLGYAIFLTLNDRYYPAPGKLIESNGHKMHVQVMPPNTHEQCPEVAGPTVVFEAGFACFSSVWNLIQPEVAHLTTTVSYDRAGLGWSETSNNPRTSTNMVQELHTLLEQLNLPKPYILVGHSLGGLLMQLYANTYPEEVYGLVLVDSSHEKILDLAGAFNNNYYNLLPESQQLWHRFLLEHGFETVSNFTGVRALYLYALFKNGIATIPEEIKGAFLSRMVSPTAVTTRGLELYHITETHNAVARSTNGFYEKPLVVISRGKAFDEESDPEWLRPYLLKVHEEVWDLLQKDLVTKSRFGKQIIAKNSGHTIVWSEPEIVIDAITGMIENFRKAK